MPRVAGVTVLFVNTPTRAPLGADTWVHGQIMRSLDRTTHELHAACARGPVDAPTVTYQLLERIPDLRLVTVNLGVERSRRSLASTVAAVLGTIPAAISLVRLAWYIRRHRVDIIHTSDRPRDALACVLLARATRTMCVVHAHVGYGDWMSPTLRWALRRADGLIAVSQFVADTWLQAGIDAERIHVVHNGIDTREWVPGVGRDAARAELGVDAGTAVVLTVCRLFPSKGPAELIAACAEARVEHRRLKLIIVGEDVTGGGFLEELRRVAAEHGMIDHVVFAGRRDDVPQLMAASDVFAMPSFGEPFGLVYLEAMAMERPVVGLAHGGTLEVVEHDVTGLLSEPGDADGLARNLVTLVDDAGLRMAMGRRGRQVVTERFTLDAQATGTAAVYRSVLDRD